MISKVCSSLIVWFYIFFEEEMISNLSIGSSQMNFNKYIIGVVVDFFFYKFDKI